jgi:hypothetical protein
MAGVPNKRKEEKMICNLKAFGLTLIAIFALSAVAASVASATSGQFTSDGPVTLTGEETGGVGSNYYEAFGQRIECPNSTYFGHELSSTNYLENGDTTATITPNYPATVGGKINCHTSSGLPVTVTPNGCDFVFRISEKVSPSTYRVLVDVVCPGTNVIALHVYFDEKEEMPACTLTVGSQVNLTGLHLKHTTSFADDIDVEGQITNLSVTRDAGICGTQKTIVNGVLKTDLTVTGHNQSHEPTAVTVTDK